MRHKSTVPRGLEGVYFAPIGGGLIAATVRVTRALADEWLAAMPRNRNLRKSRLKEIERTLELGQWKLNGQTVVFDEHALVSDGQHRLTACSNTGIAFDTVVVVNVPRANMHTVDTGAPRSNEDVLVIEYDDGRKSIATAIRILAALDRGTELSTELARISHSDIKRIYKETDYSRELSPGLAISKMFAGTFKVAKGGKAVKKTLSTCTPAVIASSYALCARIDKAYAEAFFRALASRLPIDEIGLEQGDNNPVVRAGNMLKEWTQERAVVGGAGKEMMWLAQFDLIFRAWNDSRRGVERRKAYPKYTFGTPIGRPA